MQKIEIAHLQRLDLYVAAFAAAGLTCAAFAITSRALASASTQGRGGEQSSSPPKPSPGKQEIEPWQGSGPEGSRSASTAQGSEGGSDASSSTSTGASPAMRFACRSAASPSGPDLLSSPSKSFPSFPGSWQHRAHELAAELSVVRQEWAEEKASLSEHLQGAKRYQDEQRRAIEKEVAECLTMILHLREEVDALKLEKARSLGLQRKNQQGKEPRDSLVERRPSPPVERRRAVALLVRQDLERVVGELALKDGIVEGAAVAAGAEADAVATERAGTLSSGAPCSPSSVSAEPSTAAFAGSKVDFSVALSLARSRALSLSRSRSLSRARALSLSDMRARKHSHTRDLFLAHSSISSLFVFERTKCCPFAESATQSAAIEKALCVHRDSEDCRAQIAELTG
jgi:hypothetical protein